MSRSRKSTPIHGIAAVPSDKPFKEQEHRRERRTAKTALAQGAEPVDSKAFGDPWNSPKDGKRFEHDPTPKTFRK